MRFPLTSVIRWLRAGYPHGVPQEDYIALFGVLQRHLTQDEIIHIVGKLRAARGADPIPDEHIRAACDRVVRGHAADEDVQRVAAHLAAGGWPLAGTAEAEESAPEDPHID